MNFPLRERLDQAVKSAVDWLEKNQHPSGYWAGRLETNSSMEAEWILAMHFLGVNDDPKHEGVVRAILNKQRPDGSWEVFHEAPQGDISTTVECYAALRCAGMGPESDPLVRARRWILAHGGVKNVRVFTRIWLALIGEWPWDGTPQLPPEIILLPAAPWFPFNIYQFSSWARATMVPLTILSATRPVRPLQPESRLDELFPDGRDKIDYGLLSRNPGLSWEAVFLVLDRVLRLYGKLPWRPVRRIAMKLCLEWIIRHQDADGAWGGIQPPWIYGLMALRVGGYALDHPVLAKGLAGFNEPWAHKSDDGIFLQASNSPVWDTFLSLTAMLDCGINHEDSEAFRRALSWVINEEIRTPGDWQVAVANVEPSGWAFEWENNAYPDCDDTAVGLALLQRIRGAVKEELRGVVERASNWLLAMQCSNGGWASFDKDNHHELITKIPFCDFGEVLDPPSVDVTAHVIEALGYAGMDTRDPVVAKAVQYVFSEQEKEGSWFGRWGVNHIYGTSSVLTGLRAVGFDMNDARVRKAAAWLLAHQNEDGGWGETCSSYMDDSLRGVGKSTASQTGWALMGLLAVNSPRHERAVRRGVEYLLSTQRRDGTWDEPEYTGTGFPGYGVGRRADLQTFGRRLQQGRELGRGFMLNYNMYRHYFPLMAMGRARSYFETHGIHSASDDQLIALGA